MRNEVSIYVWREEKKQAPPPSGTPKVMPRQKRSLNKKINI